MNVQNPAASRGIAIQAVDLVKNYGAGSNMVHALRGVNVSFERGKFTAIMGPSGSGKSTLMHTLAGLDSATSGHILFGGADLTRMDDKQLTLLRRHKIGFIFQSFNLLPMFTAEQNILMPLTLAGDKPDRAWFDLLVETLGLKQRLNHRPNELSGGQQQRVAIARALVKMPRVLLLDEPLSNLDARLRLQTREEIRRIQKETGITTVFVTHDQEEAMSISDMIVVMKLGVVQQIGKPQEVYDDPANLFVANFLGTPPINVFSGRVEGGKLFIGNDCVLTVGGLEDQEVTVGIRPEGFILDENGPLTCQLNNVEVMGRDVSVVSTHAASLKPSVRSIIDADDRSGLNGETVRYSVKPHKLFVFHKETEKRLAFEVK